MTKDYLWGAVFVLALAGMGAVLMYALEDRGNSDTPAVEFAAQDNPAETPNPTAASPESEKHSFNPMPAKGE